MRVILFIIIVISTFITGIFMGITIGENSNTQIKKTKDESAWWFNED